MRSQVTPELLGFILQLSQLGIIALGILIAGAALVYSILFWRGGLTGGNIARVLQQTDLPKLATIILIVLAASLLGLLGIIAGDAVIALLSAIAGYVLGSRPAPGRSEIE